MRCNNCDFVVDLLFPAESAVRCECYNTAHRIVTSTSKRWKHNTFLEGFLRPHTHGSCVVGVTDRMSKQLQATTVHLENIENIMASYDDDSSVDTVLKKMYIMHQGHGTHRCLAYLLPVMLTSRMSSLMSLIRQRQNAATSLVHVSSTRNRLGLIPSILKSMLVQNRCQNRGNNCWSHGRHRLVPLPAQGDTVIGIGFTHAAN